VFPLIGSLGDGVSGFPLPFQSIVVKTRLKSHLPDYLI